MRVLSSVAKLLFVGAAGSWARSNCSLPVLISLFQKKERGPDAKKQRTVFGREEFNRNGELQQGRIIRPRRQQAGGRSSDPTDAAVHRDRGQREVPGAGRPWSF